MEKRNRKTLCLIGTDYAGDGLDLHRWNVVWPVQRYAAEAVSGKVSHSKKMTWHRGGSVESRDTGRE